MRAMLTVEMENEAFEGRACGVELARLLRFVADRVAVSSADTIHVQDGLRLRDENGNTVGALRIERTERPVRLEPEDIPADFEVRPLRDGDAAWVRAVCGWCCLTWDDSISTGLTPAPGGRCPFEAFHEYEGGAK